MLEIRRNQGATLNLAACALVAVAAVELCLPRALAGTAPANDECGDARVVTLGDEAFSNVGANIAPPGMCAVAGHDVWFRFTSTFTGTLSISTCGSADFDTIIAVYSGCACGSFSLLGCNDDASGCAGGTSRLLVPVQAGHCYRIRVAGFNGDSGLGVLKLRAADPENAAGAQRIKTGANANDRLGFAVAGAGDANGDSFGDVIVGSHLSDAAGADAGRALVYRGSSLNSLYTFDGAAAGDRFGYSVAGGCDANDDGRDDLIVGAPLHDANGASSGRVSVYSGFDGSLLWTRDGAAAGDRFGWSVADAGDVNNDGYEDVLVGAPFQDSNVADAGRAYVLSGQDGSILYWRKGTSAGAHFGWAVTGLGDVNNDGFDDYAFSSPRHDFPGKADAGRVFVYSGQNGALLKFLDGDAAGDRFGSALAGATFSTGGLTWTLLAVGAPFHDGAGSNAGRIKVFSRRHQAPICAGLFCVQYVINGGNAGDTFGHSVALGDIVGSGFYDIIVGAPKVDLNGSNSGAVYVFNGGAGGLAMRRYGETAGDTFGHSVASAGNVDNAGKHDLLVGAPLNDAGGANAGRAYVFLAGANGQAASINLAADISGDGVVDSNDLAIAIAAWGSCPVDSDCPADLDGNGVVDVQDLLAVLNQMH